MARVLRVAQDTKVPTKPNKTGLNTFLDVQEQRFAWQTPASDVDAFYSLPSSLKETATPFGSSTRADWECTVKNKRDGENPYAGPANYDASNVQVLSECGSTKSIVFGCASRSPSFATTSPGPCYDLTGAYKMGVDRKISIGFNKDFRKPLITPATDAVYWPRLPKGSSVKIAGKLKVGGPLNGAGGRSPGPIYDTQKNHDFRSGPAFSFGGGRHTFKKKDRFQGGIFG